MLIVNNSFLEVACKSVHTHERTSLKISSDASYVPACGITTIDRSIMDSSLGDAFCEVKHYGMCSSCAADAGCHGLKCLNLGKKTGFRHDLLDKQLRDNTDAAQIADKFCWPHCVVCHNSFVNSKNKLARDYMCICESCQGIVRMNGNSKKETGGGIVMGDDRTDIFVPQLKMRFPILGAISAAGSKIEELGSWSEICDKVAEYKLYFSSETEAESCKSRYKPDFIYGFRKLGVAKIDTVFINEEDGEQHKNYDPADEAVRMRIIIHIVQLYLAILRYEDELNDAQAAVWAAEQAASVGDGIGGIGANGDISIAVVNAKKKLDAIKKRKKLRIADIESAATDSCRIIVMRYAPEAIPYTAADNKQYSPSKALRFIIVRSWCTWALDKIIHADTELQARAALPSVLIMYFFYNFHNIHLKISRATYKGNVRNSRTWNEEAIEDLKQYEEQRLAAAETGADAIDTANTARKSNRQAAIKAANDASAISLVPVYGTTAVASTGTIAQQVILPNFSDPRKLHKNPGKIDWRYAISPMEGLVFELLARGGNAGVKVMAANRIMPAIAGVEW